MTNNKKIIVSCPTCQNNVTWDVQQKFRPFCCERCRLIDLGEWAAEEKRIAGDPAFIDSENHFNS
jgi:endogenous inhibitor of DNA gyrase (YacG/DUF329 family)